MDNETSKRLVSNYLEQGWKFADSLNWLKAIECVDAALQIDPNSSDCWTIKGHFSRESREYSEAELAIWRAIDLDPQSYHAWTELGLLFKDQQLYHRAAEYLKKSTSLQPDYNTYTVLANVELTFDADAALEDAEKALELKPGWDEAILIRDAAKKLVDDGSEQFGA